MRWPWLSRKLMQPPVVSLLDHWELEKHSPTLVTVVLLQQPVQHVAKSTVFHDM